MTAGRGQDSPPGRSTAASCVPFHEVAVLSVPGKDPRAGPPGAAHVEDGYSRVLQQGCCDSTKQGEGREPQVPCDKISDILQIRKVA